MSPCLKPVSSDLITIYSTFHVLIACFYSEHSSHKRYWCCCATQMLCCMRDSKANMFEPLNLWHEQQPYMQNVLRFRWEHISIGIGSICWLSTLIQLYRIADYELDGPAKFSSARWIKIDYAGRISMVALLGAVSWSEWTMDQIMLNKCEEIDRLIEGIPCRSLRGHAY